MTDDDHLQNCRIRQVSPRSNYIESILISVGRYDIPRTPHDGSSASYASLIFLEFLIRDISGDEIPLRRGSLDIASTGLK